ncbi:hypothetical protein NKH77_21145 [Streptomyces sp. M19]
MALAAAAGVLIVGGPFAGAALTSHDGSSAAPVHTGGAAMELYRQGEKHHATDPDTGVDATVSLERRPWGTHVALRLGNVTGPRACALVAVGRDGAEQTVTTWAVPEGGYGVRDAAVRRNREPLYIHGGAAMDRGAIARFDVRTLDGERLVRVTL